MSKFVFRAIKIIIIFSSFFFPVCDWIQQKISPSLCTTHHQFIFVVKKTTKKLVKHYRKDSRFIHWLIDSTIQSFLRPYFNVDTFHQMKKNHCFFFYNFNPINEIILGFLLCKQQQRNKNSNYHQWVKTVTSKQTESKQNKCFLLFGIIFVVCFLL